MDPQRARGLEMQAVPSQEAHESDMEDADVVAELRTQSFSAVGSGQPPPGLCLQRSKSEPAHVFQSTEGFAAMCHDPASGTFERAGRDVEGWSFKSADADDVTSLGAQYAAAHAQDAAYRYAAMVGDPTAALVPAPGMVPLPGGLPMPCFGTPMDPFQGMFGGAAMPAEAWDMVAENFEERARAMKEYARSLKKADDKARSKSQGARPKAMPEGERTTLMLRNIPNDYTRDMLLDLLNQEGVDKYNFVYLPSDFRRKAGLGYAFLNLETHEAAKAAWERLEGFSKWNRESSVKVMEIAWGEPLQGLEEHINRYRNSPVMHESVEDKYKPAYFENGVRQPFPEPTKRIRPPPRTKGGPQHD